MTRIRTGIWTAVGVCALAAGLSEKVYGISLSTDAGTPAPPSAITAAASPTETTATPPPATDSTAGSNDGTKASSGTSAATIGVGGTVCPGGLPGPSLVFVSAPVPFCIDATEVTQGQYGEFLAAVKSKPPSQPEQCKWNDRFEPITFDPGKGSNGEPVDDPMPIGSCPAGVFDPARNAERAVSCVDWCDAHAYCAWAGKRLCTSIGPKPDVDVATYARSPTITEWQYACTGGGKHAYPYGDAYVVGKCADLKTLTALRAARGVGACVGTEPPFDRIRDLVGNVWEWTADCDATGDNCLTQGGRFSAPGADQSCAESGGSVYSHQTHEDFGIRCCADAGAP